MLSGLLKTSPDDENNTNSRKGSKQQTSLPSIKTSKNIMSKDNNNINQNYNSVSKSQIGISKTRNRLESLQYSTRSLNNKNSRLNSQRTREEQYDEPNQKCVLAWKNDDMIPKSRLGKILYEIIQKN